MSGSASSSSYDPYALGMPSCLAVACALARSRDAIAVTAQSAPRCMAGSTFATPILAVLRPPQRILVMKCSFAGYPAVPCYYTGKEIDLHSWPIGATMEVERFAAAYVYKD